MASGISSAASLPGDRQGRHRQDGNDDAGHFEAAGEPRRIGVDEQIDQHQEAAEKREPAEKIEHRRRSVLQLGGQPQDLAALLLTIGGERAIAARGIDRDGCEQLL